MSFISDWTTVAAYLEPLMPLINDEAVKNIMANPDGKVFYEKDGKKILAENIVFTETHKAIALQNIARMAGQDINNGNPCLTAQLPDGKRIAGASPRVCRGGHALTIRCFPKNPYTLDDLERFGSFPYEIGQLLRNEVRKASNILVVGSTDAGKTTLLNALCAEVEDRHRIITIEDQPELHIKKPDVMSLTALENTSTPVTIRDLLKQVLRHNPARIIMGEMRGAEAYDLLQALNSGHSGTMSTIHAKSAELALARLTDLVLQAGVGIPYEAIQRNVASALDLVVFQAKDEETGARAIEHICRVDGYDNDTKTILTTRIYELHNNVRLAVAIDNNGLRRHFTDEPIALKA